MSKYSLWSLSTQTLPISPSFIFYIVLLQIKRTRTWGSGVVPSFSQRSSLNKDPSRSFTKLPLGEAKVQRKAHMCVCGGLSAYTRAWHLRQLLCLGA